MSRDAVFAAMPVRAGVREERILRVRAAGFWPRLLAAGLDSFVVLSVTALVTAGAAVVFGVPMPSAKTFGPDLVLAGLLDRNPLAVGAFGILVGLSTLYQIYLGGMIGQTLGKRICHLRIISTRGTVPGAMRGVFRFLALCISVLPAGLGWLWCLFDRERRALHDHLAGTYVIVDDHE
jgi:uncharacterized RDD family membrane protein YckC